MAREKHRPMAARGAMSVPHFQFIPKQKLLCIRLFLLPQRFLVVGLTVRGVFGEESVKLPPPAPLARSVAGGGSYLHTSGGSVLTAYY